MRANHKKKIIINDAVCICYQKQPKVWCLILGKIAGIEVSFIARNRFFFFKKESKTYVCVERTTNEVMLLIMCWKWIRLVKKDIN